MSRSRTASPQFVWQSSLILLPLIVLTAIGIRSLHQDRLLVEHDARQQLQQIASDTLHRLQDSWPFLIGFRSNNLPTEDKHPAILRFSLNSNDPLYLEFNPSHQLLFPPPYPSFPLPLEATPASPRMSPDQLRLWQAARIAEFQTNTQPDPLEYYRQFQSTHPPNPWAANAAYASSLLLAKSGHLSAARDQWQILLSSTNLSDAGIPIAQLAFFQLTRSASNAAPLPPAMLDAGCSNAVVHPSILTGDLIGQASQLPHTGNTSAANDWLAVWRRHELTRQLASALRDQLQDFEIQRATSAPPAARSPPAILWIASQTCLAVQFDRTNSLSNPVVSRWLIVPAETLRARAAQILASSAALVPSCFALSLDLAGQPLLSQPAHSISGVVSKPAWLSASTPLESQPLFSISFHLVDPTALYQQHRRRLYEFGLLIAASAATALAGWLAAWSASRRQWQLSELKTNFVSSVSHELRAPIASIRLMAETLHRGKITDPSRQSGYFHLMVQECQRLSAMIQNVLDFARIEQNRREYEFELADLSAVLIDTVKLMNPSAEAKKVLLCPRLPDAASPCHATMDGRAIQQALINLIDNAIKHSPPDAEIEIGLSCSPPSPQAAAPASHSTSTSTSTCQLWVLDHGPGIPAAEHHKIFERFYRSGSELRRETAGVGIGLSIVKHIIEAHGGSVRVESSPGNGSRFILEFPAGRTLP